MIRNYIYITLLFHLALFFFPKAGTAQGDIKKILQPVKITHPDQPPRPPMPPEDRNQDEPDKVQLAAKYFNEKDYERAAVVYAELLEEKGNYLYYNNYFICLDRLGKYVEALELTKSMIKKHPHEVKYKIDQGYVYDQQGKKQKTKKIFADIIRNLPQQRYKIVNISNFFLVRNYTDYALETLEEGRKKLNDYTFHTEIANVLYISRNYSLMIETYLEYIELFPDQYTFVQNRLQYLINRDHEDNIASLLKSHLLLKIQQHPNLILFSRMLLWLSIQQKNFDIALTQAKAIDKRAKEDGETLVELANICFNHGDYVHAITAYDLVLKKGKDNYLYVEALIGLLSSRYALITGSDSYTDKDILELEKDYQQVLEDFGKTSATVPIMKDLAHIQTFYLHKPDSSIQLLNEAINIPRAFDMDVAKCKLELADIYLLTDEVWEATLLYSQVEKSFKHEPIGDLAKYKNAKLSFYIGEFDWAKSQLLVLKGSTSSLIANDALQLSVMIGDNIEADSSTTALSLYAEADLLLFKNNREDAMILLDSILTLSTYHSIFDDVLLLRGKLYLDMGMIDSAIIDFQEIADNYSWDITADNALFLMAETYDFFKNDKDKASELYLRLMTDYPGSLFVAEARKRYRFLRGDLNEDEMSREDLFFHGISL